MAATPLAAQDVAPMPEPAEDYAAMSDADLVDAWQNLDRDASTCATRLPLLRALEVLRPGVIELRHDVMRMEIWCHYERDDYANALIALKALEEVDGSFSQPAALAIAANSGQGDALLARMRIMALDGDAESYSSLTSDLWFFAQRKARDLDLTAEIDALDAEIFLRGHHDQFDPAIRYSIVDGAFNHGVASNDSRLAETAISQHRQPGYFDTYLADRKYEAYWPIIERRVGPAMETIIREYLATARRAFAADPENPENLNDLGHALYYAGEFHELLAFADAQLGRDDLEQTMVEDEGWLLNLKAYTLDALGRGDEADEVFDSLARVGRENGGWGVNFVINRASRLVGQQRWEEGLVAANEAKLVSDVYGSTFAKLLVARDQLCSLTALGRAEEAAEQLAFVRENGPEFPTIATMALLCQDREEEAVALLLEGFKNEKERSGIITEMQAEEVDLFYTPTKLRRANDLLAEHADLKSAFEEYGRTIPEEFYSMASRARYSN
ncbi:hypothetical protein [Qipengyuania vesicularis]|uniref:hypothetical protein n=1 Tax=Qipengyuania vesicularis TaxID=2867232 RepID=UPI001C885291|nr:hypothetical protein [Qipengyuania vesicularis]MBX7527650.1 hypothetical protein [Qipengyuania vesicularis]